MDAKLDTLEQLDRAILAAEDWAIGYNDQPAQFAILIKNTAKLNRQVLTFFKDFAKDAGRLIDWYAYARAVIEQRQSMQASDGSIQAYDVNVVINKDGVNQKDQDFIKFIFDTVEATTAAGYASHQIERGVPIGDTTTHSIIQQQTTEQLANLVGMQYDKTTGLITPNPNPAYSIDETTRDRIAQSIKTSIGLGEDQTDAAARLGDVIADPVRAQMIARTEAVRAYANGRFAYAQQSQATGKYWQDVGAIDECADNTSEGVIPIDATFTSGDMLEPAHPNCRCRTTFVYSKSDNGNA